MINTKPLIISRTFPSVGGREKIVNDLINSISKTFPVTIITPDAFIVHKKNIRLIKYNPNKKVWVNTLKELESCDFNVVHCHTFYMYEFSLLVANHFRVPLVFTLHGFFVDFYDKKYSSIIEDILNNSTLVTTVSAKYKKLIDKFIGKKNSVELVGNGVSIKNLKVIDKPIDKSKINVVIPARLNSLKGLDYVVDVSNIIKNNFKFTICYPTGRNSKEEIAYKKSLISKMVNSNIEFKELNNHEWLSFLKKADIVLLPSLIEGQSLSILESMLFGKIVIATRVGGTPEIIKNNVNGFLIKPKSVASIKKALINVINLSNSKSSSIKIGARKTIKESFNFKNVALGYSEVYKKAILKKQRKPRDIQAVILNNNDKEPKFLILKRLNKNTGKFEYRLVKGGLKKGEISASALKREILEETGIKSIRVLKKLKPYDYSYFYGRIYVTGTVNTFLVKALSSDNYDMVNQEEEGGFDIESILWVDYKKAFKILTYKQEKDLVVQSFQYLR